MDKKLQGKFMGCPYHDDDYEACIEYSGQAPCDPPEGCGTQTWSDDGLPPVGLKCEFRLEGMWHPCTILAHRSTLFRDRVAFMTDNYQLKWGRNFRSAKTDEVPDD